MKKRLEKSWRQLQQHLAVTMVTTLALWFLSLMGTLPFIKYIVIAGLLYCLILLGLLAWITIELHRK